MRSVKGVFFIDYVRIMRSRKDVDWSQYLRAEELCYLEEKILDPDWYPFDTFERMGLALLQEVVGTRLDDIRAFGRASVDALSSLHDSLICNGNPMESMMRFQVLRTSFFNFDPVVVEVITPDSAVLNINYGMCSTAEEAATLQTIGYLERVLELSGGQDIRFRLLSRVWEGASATKLKLSWREISAIGN